MDTIPTYSHIQKSPFILLVLGGIVIVLFIGAWFIHDAFAALILVGSSGLMLVLTQCFHHLAVEDQGEVLAIRFGPIPLFHRSVRYADIEKIEVDRTLFIEGWGIHYSLFRGGWVWNLWGRECVVVRFRSGGVLRLGTDDAENLARFLDTKIAN